MQSKRGMRGHGMRAVRKGAMVGALAGSLTACVDTAWAQSSVTLYGFLYSGIRHVSNSNGEGLTGLATGPSRWGIKGQEDVGGGMRALFTLESGFDMSTGNSRQGGRLFGRQAFVGLASPTLGTVTLGRQYDFVADWIAPFTPPGKWNGYMAHVGDNDNTNWQFRINHAVKYVSPDFGGLQAGAMYGFGEVAGDSQRNATMSLGVSYTAGRFKAAAAYLHIDNPASAVSEGNWNTILFPSVSATSPLQANPIAPSSMSVAAVAGQYEVDQLKVALSYSQSRYKRLGDAADGLADGNVRFHNADINATYSVTPVWQLGLGYTYTTGKVHPTEFTPKYHQFNAMTNYFLSRRTILQAGVVYQRAAGDARHAYLLFGSNAASSSRNQMMLLGGIYHFF